jgi:hypothetical protein
MSEKTQRERLGSIDFAATSPYDLAVVLVEYVQSSNYDHSVANVATVLQRWHEATVAQAAPKLQAQLERSKGLLQNLANKITSELQAMDRWQEPATKEANVEPER